MPDMLELKPFSPTKADLRVETELHREDQSLLVCFTVTGEIWNLRMGEKEVKPHRQDELWKSTCFELFLALSPNDPKYWEINLSPSENWNSYSFEGYRQAMRQEPGLTVTSVQFKREDTRIVLDAKIDLSHLNIAGQLLDVSATAVIEDDQGTISYWALKHCGKKEDFHLRESFVLKI